jgi:tRNA dimethylallyltransferase
MSAAGRKRPALVIAGPTCSGKSALALMLAGRFGGTVINADSMQVYAELRILTARPTAAEEAAVPHALYGVRPAAQASTVAWWRAAALAAMRDAADAGRVPILCGGTGLYLAALFQGLAEIPDTGAEAREEARALLATEGAAALHARLAQADPRTASGLRPSDGQRLARAWEVLRGTGTGLAAWQARHAPPAFPWALRAIILDPPRAALREAIAARFDGMVAQGGVDEARALLSQGLDPALPAMRAHGVPELAAYLRGEITLAEAGKRTILATGQYTKRQATWLRHRPVVPGEGNAAEAATHRFLARYGPEAQLSESLLIDIDNFIRFSG